MTWKQAFPIIYRKLKNEYHLSYNSMTLIDKLKKYNEKVGNITEKHIDAIIAKIVEVQNKAPE
jgi:hypothetical protein